MKAMRLHTRIAALLVLVVLGTQALTFIAVQVATERSVKAQLGEELLIGERVWQRINQRRDEQLLQSASVLADDFGFRAAVASGDVPTMQSALRNHAARMDAQTAVLLSPEGDFLTGLADLPQAEQLRAVQALLQQAQHDGRAVGVVALDQHVVRLAVVQVLAPSRVGWIAIGNESGDSLAQDFRSTTGLDATFFIDGAPPRVLASTLQPAERTEFAQQLRTAEHAQGAAIPLTLGDSRYLVKLQSIQGDTRVRVALQASLDRAVAPYRTLKLRILLLAGLATAAALGVSIFSPAASVSRWRCWCRQHAASSAVITTPPCNCRPGANWRSWPTASGACSSRSPRASSTSCTRHATTHLLACPTASGCWSSCSRWWIRPWPRAAPQRC